MRLPGGVGWGEVGWVVWMGWWVGWRMGGALGHLVALGES